MSRAVVQSRSISTALISGKARNRAGELANAHGQSIKAAFRAS